MLAAFVLAAWRFGTDLGWTKDFIIPTGPLSHWQTWLAIAIASQIAVLAMNRWGSAKIMEAVNPQEESEREAVLKSQLDRVL